MIDLSAVTMIRSSAGREESASITAAQQFGEVTNCAHTADQDHRRDRRGVSSAAGFRRASGPGVDAELIGATSVRGGASAFACAKWTDA